MPDLTIDCLRRDECQPLTNEQMNNIKSQFHPSNTANVNIVPYHIYDEDGAEIKVGEVRKTIDGVKKNKPVYSRLFVFGKTKTLTDNSWNNHFLGTTGIDIKCSRTYITVGSSDNRFLAEGYYRSATEYVTIANDITDLNIRPNMNAGTVYLYSCYIEYTKDSDEWEVV